MWDHCTWILKRIFISSPYLTLNSTNAPLSLFILSLLSILSCWMEESPYNLILMGPIVISLLVSFRVIFHCSLWIISPLLLATLFPLWTIHPRRKQVVYVTMKAVCFDFAVSNHFLWSSKTLWREKDLFSGPECRFLGCSLVFSSGTTEAKNKDLSKRSNKKRWDDR